MTCFPLFHAYAQHSSVSEELELLTNVYFDELDISYSERSALTLAHVLNTCNYLLAVSLAHFSLSIHPPFSSPPSLLLSAAFLLLFTLQWWCCTQVPPHTQHRRWQGQAVCLPGPNHHTFCNGKYHVASVGYKVWGGVSHVTVEGSGHMSRDWWVWSSSHVTGESIVNQSCGTTEPVGDDSLWGSL